MWFYYLESLSFVWKWIIQIKDCGEDFSFAIDTRTTYNSIPKVAYCLDSIKSYKYTVVFNSIIYQVVGKWQDNKTLHVEKPVSSSSFWWHWITSRSIFLKYTYMFTLLHLSPLINDDLISSRICMFRAKKQWHRWTTKQYCPVNSHRGIIKCCRRRGHLSNYLHSPKWILVSVVWVWSEHRYRSRWDRWCLAIWTSCVPSL